LPFHDPTFQAGKYLYETGIFPKRDTTLSYKSLPFHDPIFQAGKYLYETGLFSFPKETLH